MKRWVVSAVRAFHEAQERGDLPKQVTMTLTESSMMITYPMSHLTASEELEQNAQLLAWAQKRWPTGKSEIDRGYGTVKRKGAGHYSGGRLRRTAPVYLDRWRYRVAMDGGSVTVHYSVEHEHQTYRGFLNLEAPAVGKVWNCKGCGKPLPKAEMQKLGLIP